MRPGRRRAAARPSAPGCSATRVVGSPGTTTCITAATAAASATVRANTDGQSRLRTAGTTPRVLIRPTVGFTPTIPLSAAGTRPEPAVSVPRANGTNPSATATAEPELDPPGTSAGSSAFGGVPYGERVPTSPVANWSRLALPTRIAPASRNRATTSASSVGTYAAPGHAAVVGTPATSMLSLTTNGTPNSGSDAGSTPASAATSARARSTHGGPISTPGGAPSRARSTPSTITSRDMPPRTAAANSGSPHPVGSTAIVGLTLPGQRARRPRRRPRRTPRPASSPSSAPRRGSPGRWPRCSR